MNCASASASAVLTPCVHPNVEPLFRRLRLQLLERPATCQRCHFHDLHVFKRCHVEASVRFSSSTLRRAFQRSAPWKLRQINGVIHLANLGVGDRCSAVSRILDTNGLALSARYDAPSTLSPASPNAPPLPYPVLIWSTRMTGRVGVSSTRWAQEQVYPCQVPPASTTRVGEGVKSVRMDQSGGAPQVPDTSSPGQLPVRSNPSAVRVR